MTKTPWWESDHPEDWPSPLQDLRWTEEERKENALVSFPKPKRIFPLWSLPLSAAAAFIFIFWMVGNRGKKTDSSHTSVLITDVRGNVELRRKDVSLTSYVSPGSRLLPGDLWILSERSRVQISPAPGISLRLQGPGIVAWKEAISEGIPRLHLKIRSGEVSVLSDPRAAKSLVWESGQQTYVLLGTFARLKVEANSDSLDVWEGKIQLLSDKLEFNSVEEGKSYRVKETNGVYADQLITLSYSSLREGGILKNELNQESSLVDSLSETSNESDEKPARTWEELTELYGKAATIKFKDGHEIFAVWYVKGGKWYILTPEKTMVVPPESILSLDN